MKEQKMVDLLSMQKYFILSHLGEGDSAVDFTMGNGYDTVFLSKTVGASGHVTAFDIQPAALHSTAKNLRENNCPDNWRLICASHHRVKEFVKAPFKAGMFNLGYLPGGMNKQVTTLRPTTMEAVQAAISLLDRDGGLLIAVYPGHEEGRLEGEMLTEYFATLDRKRICVGCFRIINSPTSPFFFTVETK